MFGNKRGVFFSLDAVLAVAIIVLVILISFPLINRDRSVESLHYDVLSTFSSLAVSLIIFAILGSSLAPINLACILLQFLHQSL